MHLQLSLACSHQKVQLVNSLGMTNVGLENLGTFSSCLSMPQVAPSKKELISVKHSDSSLGGGGANEGTLWRGYGGIGAGMSAGVSAGMGVGMSAGMSLVLA